MGVNLLSLGQSFVELLPCSISAYFINQSVKAICSQSKMTSFFIEMFTNVQLFDHFTSFFFAQQSNFDFHFIPGSVFVLDVL